MNKYLLGFDFVEYLRRHHLLGRLHPADQRSTEPIIDGLLVPVETALNEITHWSGQDISRMEFLNYLKRHDIHTGDAHDLLKTKQKAKEQGLRIAVNASGKLKEIADAIEVSYSHIDGARLCGRDGSIREDGLISVTSKSKRHLSGIKRRLGFLQQTEDGFRLDRPLTAREAEALRAVLGIKKRPSPRTSEKHEAPIEKVAA